ncbi:LpxI family protein [Jannaschia sp. W003]|uniref:LpxI family protein n=1 Tax=Jannaschia sp. W003 TaxID=2867012 RepID=UPI0021A47D32|nr:UDP-2,3-diacylglucosamine diphosphatase LpxI [Jannaschia sp. W003]UWQ20467.1 UDP-2,3-diacylglucosamine diphosphatase LpxI [Jannaschia sp. W003]
MRRTVLVAGEGALPRAVTAALDAAGTPWIARHLDGHVPEGIASEPFRIERLGTLLEELAGQGVGRAIFAGRIARPPIDPAKLDAATMPLVPRIAAAVARGDDGALREVIAVFEERGIAVAGLAEAAPSLLEVPEIGTPTDRDVRDVARAREVHAALGALDIGQGVVVAGGQVLAVEAQPGTDWMLESLQRPSAYGRPEGGVLLKAPKAAQDRRIDLPAIGPDTVRRATAAGLRGIAVERGGTVILHGTGEAAAAAGLFLHAFAP